MMSLLVASFAAVLVVASGEGGETFESCADFYCKGAKDGSIQKDDKVVVMIKSFGMNMESCKLTPNQVDGSFPKTCEEPKPPKDVTLTCAVQDENGKFGEASCYDTTVGFGIEGMDCKLIMEKLTDFINESDIKCLEENSKGTDKEEPGTRRKRSANFAGFDLIF